MTKRILTTVWATLVLFLLLGCQPNRAIPVLPKVESTLASEIEFTNATPTPEVQEVDILTIPLTEPLNVPEAEISGMDWYGDKLVLLPQYPDRFIEDGLGSLFYINQSDIINYIENPEGSPVSVHRIAFDQSGIQDDLRGFEGFESITFYENNFFVTVETKPGVGMKGFVYKGEVANDLSLMTILPGSFQEIRPQANFSNASEEAIIVFDGHIYTFYEDYGKNKNNNPRVHVFDLDLQNVQTIPMANIEYRFTDATRVDADGYFWAMNYFYPGDTHLLPAIDPIADQYGKGVTHTKYEPVERLVKFHISENGISLVDQAPIQFKLLPNDEARNWEGLVVLDGFGFLMVTDKFPSTILGFCESLR